VYRSPVSSHSRRGHAAAGFPTVRTPRSSGRRRGLAQREIPLLVAGLTRLAELWTQAGAGPGSGPRSMGGAAGGAIGLDLAFSRESRADAGEADWCWSAPGSTTGTGQGPTCIINRGGVFDKTSLRWKGAGRSGCGGHRSPGRRLPSSPAGSKGWSASIPVGGDGDGRFLDAPALAQMAEQVAREALRL